MAILKQPQRKQVLKFHPYRQTLEMPNISAMSYPAIIDYDIFAAKERLYAEQLGRIRQTEKEEEVIFPTTFHMREVTDELDDPLRRQHH